jgi:hypothetical protein
MSIVEGWTDGVRVCELGEFCSSFCHGTLTGSLFSHPLGTGSVFGTLYIENGVCVSQMDR